jgi:transposase
MAADGQANERIAAAVGVWPTTVRAWRARFAEEGAARLGHVRKGRGPKPSITREQVEQIVHDTLHAKPKGETPWSTRSMARRARCDPIPHQAHRVPHQRAAAARQRPSRT